LEKKAKALVLEASETTEGHLVKELASRGGGSTPEKDGVFRWEVSYKDILERLRYESSNLTLSLAVVRNVGNSLGFKTEKSEKEGVSKRRITCKALVFDSLKKRYIPSEEDKSDSVEQKADQGAKHDVAA
jgi:hypothetical protein